MGSPDRALHPTRSSGGGKGEGRQRPITPVLSTVWRIGDGQRSTTRTKWAEVHRNLVRGHCRVDLPTCLQGSGERKRYFR